MGLLSEEDKKVILDMFNSMSNKATIAFFTETGDASNCAHCKDTQTLLEELSSISDKVQLKIYDFTKEKEKAQTLGIDKIPAITLQDDKEQDCGIRFYGLPGGYEFGTLVEDIVMVGKKDSGLSQEVKDKIKTVTKDTHIQVFVTPT